MRSTVFPKGPGEPWWVLETGGQVTVMLWRVLWLWCYRGRGIRGGERWQWLEGSGSNGDRQTGGDRWKDYPGAQRGLFR